MKISTKRVKVTQLMADIERFDKYRRKTAAFEEWRKKLFRNDRLPRGKFFVGKKPGGKLVAIDESWQMIASNPK
ncbi:hypothetical protein ACI2KR_27110 [Pseudomonas luteola]